MESRIVCLMLLAFLAVGNADIYMHNPRGSNNRQEEQNRERNNANRLFDSQNNNRGGYNSGEGGMYYYAGSKLPIQWTSQHSCSNVNSNCEIVIQYMCGDDLRDGTSTQTIRDSSREYTRSSFGMHEDYFHYKCCKETERNKGLFTADQNLKGTSSKFTRQNPNGQRSGFECPEERDYYPYWQPSPWIDIAVLTNDESRCSYYKAESQNVKPRSACVMPESSSSSNDRRRRRRRRRSRRRRRRSNQDQQNQNQDIPITQAACQSITGATWREFPSAAPAGNVDCRKNQWSRDNHNGNGEGGYMNTYDWTVPNIEADNCALRIRYNISTEDFNTWNTFSDKNGNNPTNVDISNLVDLSSSDATSRGYVFKNNPQVEVLSSSSKLKLQLAINTAQYGRTFQDRSHKFEIRKRPASLNNVNIYNMNVRGKRGNIVQVYPAVEYDFVPNQLEINEEDYVHYQWTGSNKNPQNNDGEGRRGTDRSNVVLLKSQVYSEGREKASNVHGHYGRSYPENIDAGGVLGLNKDELTKLAILKRGSGRTLDSASPYFDMGPKKVTSAGIFFYMCTRNNNFSNRSQKGKIIVKRSKRDAETSTWADSVSFANSQTQHSSISVEELSADAGEKMLKENGGAMEKGDGYASNYMAVYPMEKFPSQDSKLTVNLKLHADVDAEDVTVYHSPNMKSWRRLKDPVIQAGQAKISLDQGGLYVARFAKASDSYEDYDEYNDLDENGEL